MQTLSQVTIASLGQRGEGVAEIDNQRVYVPFSLPGETVEITVEGERGHLLSILEPSPHRIDPFCPHFGVCGGCQLQHLDRPSYDAFKIGLIENALSHAGITTPVGALIDARGAGRRRATLHARKTGAGYMMAKSHDLLDIDRCPILVPALASTPEIARGAYAAIGGDCDVSFTASATGLDVAIRTEKKPRNDRLVTFAQRFALARLVVNGELILQAQQPLIRVGKSMVDLPRASFLQATEAAEEALSTLVVQALAGTKSVADLFCGMGPFALRLAETMKVFAADNDKPAILALEKAVRNTRGLKPVTAMTRDLFRDSMVPVELAPFDGVVFDPPRAGAEAQAHELALSKVKKIVAVSCDPKTFARDAAILIGGGYKLQSVTPVDQFAFSTHVELVGVFAR
ncbi:MAG: RumA [Hyphomicrobiales bacterium]|nr:RumA [Hyphomicrobiales bacterium]